MSGMALVTDRRYLGRLGRQVLWTLSEVDNTELGGRVACDQEFEDRWPLDSIAERARS